MSDSQAYANTPEEGIDDMTSLRQLSEQDLLRNIEVRYFKDKIYVRKRRKTEDINRYDLT
jgi:myosin heavy subunit